jgi:hypothetical protein
VSGPHQADAGNADQGGEPNPRDQVRPQPAPIQADSEADPARIPSQQDNGEERGRQPVEDVGEVVEDVQPDVARVGTGDDRRGRARDAALDGDLGPHVVEQGVDAGQPERDAEDAEHLEAAVFHLGGPGRGRGVRGQPRSGRIVAGGPRSGRSLGGRRRGHRVSVPAGPRSRECPDREALSIVTEGDE